MNKTDSSSRREVLEGAPLRYAPANELGVVFLFAHLARKWRLRGDAVQSGTYQKSQGKEKRIRIEFEFRSRQTDFWATSGVKQSCGSRYENGWRIPTPLALLLVLRQQGVISDADLERARKVVAGSAIA